LLHCVFLIFCSIYHLRIGIEFSHEIFWFSVASFNFWSQKHSQHFVFLFLSCLFWSILCIQLQIQYVLCIFEEVWCYWVINNDQYWFVCPCILRLLWHRNLISDLLWQISHWFGDYSPYDSPLKVIV
jgi:hypothetical protein